jgi:tryptophanyl-tRNA synthetase
LRSKNKPAHLLHPFIQRFGIFSLKIKAQERFRIGRANIKPPILVFHRKTVEIAKRFNHLFGFTFEPIKPLLAKGARIMSLDDPKKKMSKSGDSGISLADTPEQMSKKIKRAVTDSGSEIRYTPGAKPAVSNLMLIYSELSGKDLKSIETTYKGKGCADFKKNLAEVVVEHFVEFRKKRAELEKDPALVASVLQKGKERAAEIAAKTLTEVRRKMGFL